MPDGTGEIININKEQERTKDRPLWNTVFNKGSWRIDYRNRDILRSFGEIGFKKIQGCHYFWISKIQLFWQNHCIFSARQSEKTHVFSATSWHLILKFSRQWAVIWTTATKNRYQEVLLNNTWLVLAFSVFETTNKFEQQAINMDGNFGNSQYTLNIAISLFYSIALNYSQTFLLVL